MPIIFAGMGEELAVSGPVFDSFSESNSRDGSVRAGTSYKASPVQVARLKACLEEVAAGRASVSAEPGMHPSCCCAAPLFGPASSLRLSGTWDISNLYRVH